MHRGSLAVAVVGARLRDLARRDDSSRFGCFCGRLMTISRGLRMIFWFIRLMCEYSSGSNDIEELQWRFGALFELEKPRGCTGGFTWEKRSEEREDDECLGGVSLCRW